RDERIVDAWDRHDWARLFLTHAGSWRHDIGIHVFGHALLEHALYPQPYLVGKAVLVCGDPAADPVPKLAQAIESGQLLRDPQELRPLPLAGVPGWHARAGEPAFYHEAPCF